LFSAIKASRHQNIAVNASYLSFKPGNIGNHELKRLICSVTYDMKGGHSDRGKGTGRGFNCFL
jgi:hypothetical protein